MGSGKENAVFCPQCGTENDGDARFCQNCGTAQSVVPLQAQPVAKQVSAKGPKKILVLIIAVVFLVTVIAAVAYFLIGGRSGITNGRFPFAAKRGPSQEEVDRCVSETKSNLGAIRSTEVAYFAEWGTYVGGQAATPVPDRRGNGKMVSWKETEKFNKIGFAPESGTVMCSYGLEGPANGKKVKIVAVCDCNEDGNLSTWFSTSESSEIGRTGDLQDNRFINRDDKRGAKAASNERDRGVIDGIRNLFNSVSVQQPGKRVLEAMELIRDGKPKQLDDFVLRKDVPGAGFLYGMMSTAFAEHGGVSRFEIESENIDGDSATVRVRFHFTNGGGSNYETFPMKREDGKWRIHL